MECPADCVFCGDSICSASETEQSCVQDCSVPEADFVTTWATNIGDDPTDSTIIIPTGTGTFDFQIDWNNDGVFEIAGVTSSMTP